MTDREYMDEFGENPNEIESEYMNEDAPRCRICGRILSYEREVHEYNGFPVYENIWYCPVHD